MPTSIGTNVGVTDNLDSSPGVIQDVKPPQSTKLLWLNTGSTYGNVSGIDVRRGEMAAYDEDSGEWRPVNRSVILEEMYPVGSVYMTTTDRTPGEYIRGTEWIAWGSGRVPVSVNTGDGNFNSVEKTGGSKDAVVVSHGHSENASGYHDHGTAATDTNHTHSGGTGYVSNDHVHGGNVNATGTNHTHDAGGLYLLMNRGSGNVYVGGDNFIDEIPSWITDYAGESVVFGCNTAGWNTGMRGNTNWMDRNNAHGHSFTTGGISANHAHSFETGWKNHNANHSHYVNANGSHSHTVNANGESGANKNIQPYITCYMWKRTA